MYHSFFFDRIHPFRTGLGCEKGVRTQARTNLYDNVSWTNSRLKGGLKSADAMFAKKQSRIVVIVKRFFPHRACACVVHGSTSDKSSAHSSRFPVLSLNSFAALTILISTD